MNIFARIINTVRTAWIEAEPTQATLESLKIGQISSEDRFANNVTPMDLRREEIERGKRLEQRLMENNDV